MGWNMDFLHELIKAYCNCIHFHMKVHCSNLRWINGLTEQEVNVKFNTKDVITTKVVEGIRFRCRKSTKFLGCLAALMATPTKGTVAKKSISLQKRTNHCNCNQLRNILVQLNKICETLETSIISRRESFWITFHSVAFVQQFIYTALFHLVVRGMAVKLHIFLTLVVDVVSIWLHVPVCLPPGVLVGHRTCLKVLGKAEETRSSQGRTDSQMLVWLTLLTALFIPKIDITIWT